MSNLCNQLLGLGGIDQHDIIRILCLNIYHTIKKFIMVYCSITKIQYIAEPG